MRSYIVFVLLTVMLGLFVVLQLTREPRVHQVTGAALAGTGSGSGTGRTAGTGTGTGMAGSGRGAGAAKKKVAPAPLPPRMKRPLRVAGLGWELVASGVVANKGATSTKKSLFTDERLEVHVTAFQSMEQLEAALARGGADPAGADIAILPLPELVAAQERIRALALQVFLVLGWSHGRDGLMASPAASLVKLPRGRVDLLGKRGQSATFFALLVLELAGLPASRVRLLDAGDRGAGKAPFAAMERPLPDGVPVNDRKFITTTADATRLVPVVAVAPMGLIKSNANALTAWGRVWLDGVEQLRSDVPAAAREVAAHKGAPHALDLLKRLGQIDAAPLMDNARLAGLSGRDPVTLEQLYRRCWHIWREAGVLSSPLPDPLPIHTGIMASMVRTYPSMVEREPPPTPRSPDGKAPASGDALATLLVHRPGIQRWDRQALVEQVGFLVGIMGQAQLEISVRDNLVRARELTLAIKERYEIRIPDRLKPARHRGDGLAQVQIQLPR